MVLGVRRAESSRHSGSVRALDPQHPTPNTSRKQACVAHRNRASPCEGEGSAFNSRRRYSGIGKVTASGGAGCLENRANGRLFGVRFLRLPCAYEEIDEGDHGTTFRLGRVTHAGAWSVVLTHERGFSRVGFESSALRLFSGGVIGSAAPC